ncbi:alkaline phosphatase D family protein [Hydrogenophaga sp. 5NK40-0174]|uniref:alkaline phosphatase D family protein n=1 Tax=Hydrogenophaga sp. 5NK40-0174 TaxID=3127649 RepID=UPI00310379FD
MTTRLGPLLQFLGCQNNEWGISVLVITGPSDPPPSLHCASSAVHVQPPLAGPVPGTQDTAWRFDLAVSMGIQTQRINYRLNGKRHTFHVPALGAMPDCAYASCNGFSDGRDRKSMAEPNALWTRMARLHREVDLVDNTHFGPLQLLLMGGDQIYSDDIWNVIPELRAWSEMPWRQRLTAPWTPQLETAVQSHFARLYIERWSQPEVAAVLASIPAVMMWDDHDIIDGWGSHPAELHQSPVFQGLFKAASQAFALFQRHSMGAPPPATLAGQPAHNSGYRAGPMGLLVLDMRTERSPRLGANLTHEAGTLVAEQVLSSQSWSAVYQWLDAELAKQDMRHLFVMSSIPVVHPSFELLEKLLGVFPGQQELEDDLRDHWTSPPHKAERLRLVHRLLEASAKGVRITLLSGDVHVAAVGVIESSRSDVPVNARVINQLTSSGIVHPPPPGVALFFLEQACKNVETIDRGISGAMYEFPTTSHRMIGCRNFMTLQADRPGSADRYWVNWWTEGESHPFTKVIHPVNLP